MALDEQYKCELWTQMTVLSRTIFDRIRTELTILAFYEFIGSDISRRCRRNVEQTKITILYCSVSAVKIEFNRKIRFFQLSGLAASEK